MAPLTPQGTNSRLPKIPGPGPQQPTSFGYQRRSLLTSPHTPQAATYNTGGVNGLGHSFTDNSSHTAEAFNLDTPLPSALSSPVTHYNANNSISSHSHALASPLSLQSPASIGKASRQSTTLTNDNEATNFGPRTTQVLGAASSIPAVLGQPTQQHHTSTTSFLPSSASSSSSTSPTIDSPQSASRPSLGSLRLSATSSGTVARAPYMKQPLLQRTPATGATSTVAAKLVTSTTTQSPSASLSVSTANAASSVPQVDDRVTVESMGLTGYLRFLGTTSFKSGVWAGIELDTPTGKNDGTVAGVFYFNCKPKSGIFVLAAKVTKVDQILVSSQDNTHPQEESPDTNSRPTHSSLLHRPSPATGGTTSSESQAAQAASRISAGSRASKYIGMTASQLKQQQNINIGQTAAMNRPTGTARAAQNVGAKVTTAAVKTRPGPGQVTTTVSTQQTSRTRTSPTPSRPSALATPPQPRRFSNRANITESKSSSSLQTPSSATSSLPDQLELIQSPTNSASQRLHQQQQDDLMLQYQQQQQQHDDLVLQYQQLQLQLDVAIAENNMLKTEMSQTKSQMEVNRLLEKREQLSYDERAFLSKSLGRGGIDERLGQELESLHAMKRAWEEERQVKDQELEAMTDEMTRAWTDISKSQREYAELEKKTIMLQELLKAFQEREATLDLNRGEPEKAQYGKENQDLDRDHHDAQDQERDSKQDLEQNLEQNQGRDQDKDIERDIEREQEQLRYREQQELVLELQGDLEAAQVRTRALESELNELSSRAARDHEVLITAAEDAESDIQSRFLEQLSHVEQERDALQVRLDDMESLSRSSTEALESKLEAATRETTEARTQLNIIIAELEHEVESHHFRESVAEGHLKKAEQDLHDTKLLLAKAEKSAKASEERAKQTEATLQSEKQELARLRQELEDLAEAPNTEEVERLRKVWDLEKKRFEETNTENQARIRELEAKIETFEANEEDLIFKITDLEEEAVHLLDTKATIESELARLKETTASDKAAKEKKLVELETVNAETKMTMEARTKEAGEKQAELEASLQSLAECKTRCQELEEEVTQARTLTESISQQLKDAQVKIDGLDQQRQESLTSKKELEDKVSALGIEHSTALEKVKQVLKLLQHERDEQSTKIAELENALASSTTAHENQGHGASQEQLMSLEDEISQLKQTVIDLTRENVTVANVNKKLMQEHDNLMEAHKHVESECLKLMDEVERLHSESLAADMTMDASTVGEDTQEILTSETSNTKSNAMSGSYDAAMPNAPSSVIRLEGILKEKQALLEKLTLAHSSEMRELRQRYIELDQSKAFEIAQLNKELTDLESLIESKIFHEADLEEEVQLNKKRIARLEQEIQDLKNQLMMATQSSGTETRANGASSPFPSLHRTATSSSQQRLYRSPSSLSVSSIVASSQYAPPSRRAELSTRTRPHHDQNEEQQQPLFCEICEVHGHDLMSCGAVFGSSGSVNATTRYPSSTSISSAPDEPSSRFIEDERPYCENCEEFGSHFTDECPNEAITY
ncbi:hypothetical protein BGZ94_006477 [Podila epigama]|nr:hypothetical protein BGZ94_006477 [Podila epigama]